MTIAGNFLSQASKIPCQPNSSRLEQEDWIVLLLLIEQQAIWACPPDPIATDPTEIYLFSDGSILEIVNPRQICGPAACLERFNTATDFGPELLWQAANNWRGLISDGQFSVYDQPDEVYQNAAKLLSEQYCAHHHKKINPVPVNPESGPNFIMVLLYNKASDFSQGLFTNAVRSIKIVGSLNPNSSVPIADLLLMRTITPH